MRKDLLIYIGLILCLGGLFTTGIKHDLAIRAKEAAFVQTCYKNNMVPVQTEAGPRCAKIENLVEIK